MRNPQNSNKLELETLRKEVEGLRAERSKWEEQYRARFRALELECYHLLDSACHDLSAPLRALHGYAGALAEDHGEQLKGEGRTYLERVVQSVRQMEHLIHDLRRYSQLAHQEIRWATVEIEQLARETIARFLDQTERRKQTIRVRGEWRAVRGDQGILVQVFDELLSNATKFTAPGVAPKVDVMASPTSSSSLRVVFRDNGIGIDPRHYEQIFRPFERLHGIEAYPGTGMGLAIVRKGIERMGGSVGLEPAGRKGTCIWFELPLAPTRPTRQRK